MWQTILHNAIANGALHGLGGAVLIDLVVFLKTKSPGEFFAQFQWQVAAWRYLQGLIGGALTAAGFGAMFS